MRFTLLSVFVVLAVVPLGSAAHAGITLQLPTLGAPHGTEHSLPPPMNPNIPGWTATTLRLVSDSGNITGVNFSGVNAQGIPRGVYGSFAQIWISPNSDGQYTESTPGFRTENNLTPSEFNLDSHFLGDPADFIVHSPLEEGNVDFPGFNPIASDAVYGYGNGRSFHVVHQIALEGYLRGAFDIVPSAQSISLDLAYVALGGSGDIFGEVYTTGGTFELSIGYGTGPDLPEPVVSFPLWGLMLLWARRR